MEIDVEKVFKAIRDNDLALFRGYLNQGVDVNASDSSKTPLLVYAARRNRIAMVEELLSRNADVHAVNAEGTYALMSALQTNEDPRALIAVLLAAGTNPYLVNNAQLNSFEVFNGRSNCYAVSGYAVKQSLYAVLEKDAQKFNPEPPKPPADAALTVIFNRAAGSHDVEEVYLFETKERITYYHKPGSKVLEVANREAFSTIADQQALRNAFAEHQKRGGQMAAEEVFASHAFRFDSPWTKQ